MRTLPHSTCVYIQYWSFSQKKKATHAHISPHHGQCNKTSCSSEFYSQMRTQDMRLCVFFLFFFNICSFVHISRENTTQL